MRAEWLEGTVRGAERNETFCRVFVVHLPHPAALVHFVLNRRTAGLIIWPHNSFELFCEKVNVVVFHCFANHLPVSRPHVWQPVRLFSHQTNVCKRTTLLRLSCALMARALCCVCFPSAVNLCHLGHRIFQWGINKVNGICMSSDMSVTNSSRMLCTRAKEVSKNTCRGVHARVRDERGGASGAVQVCGAPMSGSVVALASPLLRAAIVF